MDLPNTNTVWFDRLVAILFAAIAVLAVAVVILALVLFFLGSSGSDIPVP